MGWSCGKMGDKKLATRVDVQKVEVRWGEQDRSYDGVAI